MRKELEKFVWQLEENIKLLRQEKDLLGGTIANIYQHIVVKLQSILERDSFKNKVFYYAIKFGDLYLTKIGCSVTSDLGQARLYRDLDSWEKQKDKILAKVGSQFTCLGYKIVTLTLKEGS